MQWLLVEYVPLCIPLGCSLASSEIHAWCFRSISQFPGGIESAAKTSVGNGPDGTLDI